MSAMFSQNRFGAHGDVMSASPDDDAGKATLIEEIKSRARAEFARKNLPQAEMLYSKAVEIKGEDATLHSNLAAVRLGLNKPQPALENAEEALRLDAKYSKGHYRKGQALMALSRPADAAKAFRAGAVLEPQSKLWGPLVQKAVKATETAAAATAAAAETTAPNGSAGSSKPTVSSATTTSAPAVRRTSPAAASTSRVPRETSSNTSKAESTPEVGMKGYKKTADGRMTTYFNNDLSEEAKALIGDIAPKKLDASKEEGAEGTDPAGQSVSAWNKAGTWESRDMTSWAKKRLTELLQGIEYEAPEGSVEVVKVENLEGDSEISHSRGKKRYLFDFRFELKWEASDLEGGPAKGVLIYPDFGQDCDGVYDAECQVNSTTSASSKGYVEKHIRREGSGLRQAVTARLNAFTTEFTTK